MVDSPSDSPGTVVDTELGIHTDVRLMNAEITGIVTRMCEKLISFASRKGREGSELRTLVGDLEAHVISSIHDGTLPSQMLDVFNAALAAGVSVTQLDPVLTQLRSEEPAIETVGALWIMQTGILFALSCQCKVVSATVFRSRDDIEAMQSKMKANFDLAKDMAADDMDNIVYHRLVDLSAKLARFLADAAIPLPSVVYYHLRPMPVLLTSQRIYTDASRIEEIIADNKVVHPAFVRATVRAFSSDA
jgi:hypothetical protein